MLAIRIRESGQIVGEAEFRRIHSNTSFPAVLTNAILNEFNADKVYKGAEPQTSGPYSFTFEQGVEEINGKWYTKYVVGPIFVDNEHGTVAEQEASYKARVDAQVAASVRATRDGLLSASDWTQVADAPVDQAAWAVYRQALRDVPAQVGFPHNVTWPNKPE